MRVARKDSELTQSTRWRRGGGEEKRKARFPGCYAESTISCPNQAKSEEKNYPHENKPAKARGLVLAAFGGVAAEDEAGGGGFGDEAFLFVGDLALDVADGAAAADYFAFGFEEGGPDGAEEINF